jgi:SAM-dependent methyltransferase
MPPVRRPWEPSDRDTLRLTFDDDADVYDRARPVPPGAVFDELVELAALGPGSTMVEIGPGTGQATVPLAERGLRGVALELGPRLAERARRNLEPYPGLDVMTTSFEAWEPGPARFDAVVACNSFHWVEPAVRFAKAASVLALGGHLVVLATPWVIPPDADRFWWDVQDDYAAAGAGRQDPASMHPDLVGDLGAEVRSSGLFDEPAIRRHRFDVTYTADGYAEALATQSTPKQLPPEARTDLIARIHRRILARGGSLTTHLLAVLTVARVRS